ncbi:MAG: phosphonate ABC transporter, permease protein PhnE [Chloroflexi bacterium]|nr:phosphonate ABC transporter, permease protein PhnE [Chloroflexota bacterium]
MIAPLLSLVIPGAGQFQIGQRVRGLSIFIAALVQIFLIYWALDNFQVGLVTLQGVTLSWLWIFLAGYWLWNVYDVHRRARGLSSLDFPRWLIPTLVIYIIAWQVTDIRLERLVTRIDNAGKITTDLIHPDLITRDESGAFALSENFGDIFGKIENKSAPDFLVQLGLAQKDSKIPLLTPGTLVETIASGLLATLFSTVLAIPLSFFAAKNIMARLPGGAVIYYVMRTFLNVIRAIDTVIWGLVVVVWVGLGPFAGVMALTIHSIAALAKLFSEEIEHIDPGPIEAITAAGANLLQVVRYAVIPQIVPPFLVYSLLRWDINMRSATVVGFVAGGGIGYFVVESIRKGAYEQYAAALWAVAIVIILVDYISAKWRERILTGATHISAEAPRPFYKSLRAWTYIILGVIVFAYSYNVTRIDLKELLNPAPNFGRLVRDFVSINLDPEVVDNVVRQMLVTIFQALLATTLGGMIAIPFSFLAARNLTGKSRGSFWIYSVTRGLFNILRSIEALLYVAIFVFWVGIGNFAGMLALAVTTFALLGKLFSEAIENIDAGPLEAITATGANRLQAIVYGVLPQIIPPFISYGIYQWDINVRISTIVGFAGGGGVGRLLSEYFGLLQYHNAGTAVALIVVVVTVMDFASAKIREKMV